MSAVFKWKLWNIVSRSQHLQARAGTRYVRLLCTILVQHLYTLAAFSLGVGLILFPEVHGALLQKTILLLPGVAVVVKQSACGCLRANAVSICGHSSPAGDAPLGNEKATSNTLWTFSRLSALSVIIVCVNLQGCAKPRVESVIHPLK